jgi:hypothetical protein
MPRPKKSSATATHERTKRAANRKDQRSPKTTQKPLSSRRTTIVNAQDAPIEAWQQAMLPHLRQLARTNGFDGNGECAFVFLCLLRLKSFERIGEFKDWAHLVTGYPRYEIRAFVDRAKKGFLIMDGQPSEDAFLRDEPDHEVSDVNLVLMTKVLEGKLCRNASGEYSLPEEKA